MATREQLSKIHTGMHLAGMAETQVHDERLFNTVERVMARLEQKYGFNIDHETRVYKHEIYANVGGHEFSKTSFIRPDGGVGLITVNGKRLPIIAVENKRQGYDVTKGHGNAIERLATPAMIFETWTLDQPVNPFTALCWGTDFSFGSSVIHKLADISRGGTLNTVNVTKAVGSVGGSSIFFRPQVTRAFTLTDIEDIVEQVAEKALRGYAKHYGLSSIQKVA